MTTTFYPGNKQFLAGAKETTPGVAAAAPTFWIPIIDPKHTPKQDVSVDDALRGTMVLEHAQITMMEHGELQYKTYLYADSIMQHCMAALGNADTVTGTGPYTHKTSVYNGNGSDSSQPPTYTLWLFEGDKCAQFVGSKISNLKFDFKANDKPTMEVTWVSMPETYVAAVTNTPTTLKPYTPVSVSITYNGTALPQGTDVTVEIKRNAKPIPVLNGTAAPLAIYADAIQTSGQLTSVFQGSTDPQYTALTAGTSAPLVITANAPGDATHPFTIQMSTVEFETADPQPSNSQWLTIQSNYKATGNATDALDAKESTVQVILLNAASTPF